MKPDGTLTGLFCVVAQSSEIDVLYIATWALKLYLHCTAYTRTEADTG